MCVSHLDTYHFQSALFYHLLLINLTFFVLVFGFLQLKSLWHVNSLAYSLSSNVELKFQSVPGYAGPPENEVVYTIAKCGVASSLSSWSLCPLSSGRAKIKSILNSWYTLGKSNFTTFALSDYGISFSERAMALPCPSHLPLSSWLRTTTAGSFSFDSCISTLPAHHRLFVCFFFHL